MKQKIRLGDCYALSKHKRKQYTIRYISLLAALTIMCLYARAQRPDTSGPVLSGIVTDTAGQPLQGVTVAIKSSVVKTITGLDGQFALQARQQSGVLVVSYLGHETIEEKFGDGDTGLYRFTLIPRENMLEEVKINTGFQHLSTKYTTGSYARVSNERLNRSVSTNLLDRLANVTNGLLFKSAPSSSDAFDVSNIQIRGRNTLGGYSEPLVVVDNFPYDGELSNLNPADIQDITVLKDAAAASAWGARSGNGVIVITTKKGALNSRANIDVAANTNIIGKPNLFAPGLARLSSSEYMEVEQFLFNRGAYNARINSGYQSLSPAVEVFHASREGLLLQQDSAAIINQLKQQDSRNELLEYYYRTAVNQQYHGNVRGGGKNYAYFASAGYDRNLGGVVNNANDRVTLNMNHTYTMLDNRLELTANVIYTAANSERGEQIGNLYPYDRLADDNGNALVLINGSDNLRLGYLDTVGGGRLLDWHYRPLEELRRGPNSSTKRQDYRINTALQYRIWEGLKLSVRYSYGKGLTQTTTIRPLESYYTRSQINRFTQIQGNNVIRPIPVGDIFNSGVTDVNSNNGRVQLDYDRAWQNHKLNAMGGVEVREHSYFSSSYRLYGYSQSTASHQNAAVNYTETYPHFYGSGSGRVETGSNQFGNVDRFVSMYSAASYSYRDRYMLTASARRDESNIFGVAANQKGVPLWSAGLGWIVSEEPFYSTAWMPLLKLRMTYGYTGNVDKGLSALLTAQATSNLVNSYNTLYALILNPPNPSLRWERVKNINFGTDFSFLTGRLSGSIDVWRKQGLDLIGESPLAPQTGVTTFTGNTAETSSTGVDAQLTTNNLVGTVKWSTSVLHSHSRDEITTYYGNPGNNYTVIMSNTLNPLVGYPYYAMFSYRYAGLDEQGDPVGYLDGELSKAYSDIYSSSNRDDLVYHGSRVPTHFGSIINDFSWRGVGFSFSLVYRLGYYFRRNSLNNNNLYGGSGTVDGLQPDYAERWQKPGDEQFTSVPALLYPSDFFRTFAYVYSEALVERGDHVRLQDIRLSYDVPANRLFTHLQLFAYANNLGIIWRANDSNIDPDYPTDIPPARSFAIGIKASF